MINYIAYLPTLRGKHHVFVVTVQMCKWYILSLWLLQFYLYHWYFYTLHSFSFCIILNSEQYRVIIGYSPTPVQQVNVIFCWIHITDFLYYLFFVFCDLNWYNKKIQKISDMNPTKYHIYLLNWCRTITNNHPVLFWI